MVLFFCVVIGLCSFCSAEESFEKEKEVEKVSEAMGHLIGKNLQLLGLTLDVGALARGIEKASKGETSPLTEEECMEALSSLQEAAAARRGEENLRKAEEFLQNTQSKADIVSLEEGKILYEIVKKGGGEKVTLYDRPLIRYKGSYLNGETIPVIEEILDLDEAALGLKKGILGMREGEVRSLYMHPDLGLERKTSSPHSLLILEVEVIQTSKKTEESPPSGSEVAQ